MNDTATGGRTVGQVAGLSGVTVRTLHHYEQIGLLIPSGRTAPGYRVYADANIDRPSRVLYYRELGFPLEQIATMLSDAETGQYEHLERQHALLRERLRRIQAMVAAVEREMEAHMGGYNLTPEEKLEVFGGFDLDQYEDEARECWGGSEAWKQSQARAKRYTKEDWQKIQAETDDINRRLIAAMNAGTPAGSDEVIALAEEHRRHIGRWFYDCSYEIHRGLGAMYVDDPRFTANIDKAAPGLAAYMRDAIIANADRAEG